MNSTATVVLSVLLASAAAAAVSLTMLPPVDVTPGDASADLQVQIATLRQEQTALQQEVARLRAVPVQAPVTAGPQRVAATVDDQQIAAAVEAYLQQRGPAIAAGEAAAEAAFDLDTDFAKLAGTNFWGNRAMWKKAFESGQMDAVIAQFEALAKANPNDIPAQMDLAQAYMAYLQLDQSKYEYSMKADKVFDQVLALDDTHWDARFMKAVSYSFYPDFLGKKKDAIANFETLVKQQELLPVQADQAQTYLYLGNLLEQSGEHERAREAWAKGARRHPDDKELQQKIGQ